jgi:hypothetical protein
MPYLVLVLLLIIQFLVPFWMKGIFRKAGLQSTGHQVTVFLLFEICLACSVFLCFFTSWYSYWVAVDYVVPWATGLALYGDFWDKHLTGRGILAIAIVIFVPLFLFFKVGLLSVRDVHQICKEQRDRVKNRHNLSRFWKSF